MPRTASFPNRRLDPRDRVSGQDHTISHLEEQQNTLIFVFWSTLTNTDGLFYDVAEAFEHGVDLCGTNAHSARVEYPVAAMDRT